VRDWLVDGKCVYGCMLWRMLEGRARLKRNIKVSMVVFEGRGWSEGGGWGAMTLVVADIGMSGNPAILRLESQRSIFYNK